MAEEMSRPRRARSGPGARSMTQREERSQFTLGNLIASLKSMPHDDRIVFDFCGFEPTKLNSYRGYYDHLAIGVDASETVRAPVSVGDFLATCEAVLGQTYSGWKGGDYFMSEDTPIWVANPGYSTGTAVVGVRASLGSVIIETEHHDW